MFLIRIGQKLIKPLMAIVCVLLILMLQMGFIFVLIGLLPSIAAYFVDDDADRISFRTIFACNLAAMLPTITPLFISGLKMKHYDISTVIGNPVIWMFIYGGAAIGWGMIHFGSTIALAFLEMQYKYRAGVLEKNQGKLLEEWGDNITKTVKPS